MLNLFQHLIFLDQDSELRALHSELNSLFHLPVFVVK